MVTIDLIKRYEGMPKQLEFILSNSFHSYCFGGFGNGKTDALCQRALVLAGKYPEAMGLIGRATYSELRDSTQRSFFSVCPDELIKEYRKAENTVILKNGATILFKAFDDPRKILSMNLGWFGIDQLEEVEEEIFLQLLGRLRSPECQFAFGVGNPDAGWVKKRLKDASITDKSIKFIEATSFENPHLPKDYITNTIKNYPDFWVKRYIYGDWATFEGKVFTEFVEAKNVIDPFDIPKSWKKEFIIDYGYRNPLAVLKIVIDYDDNYFVIDEHYEREKIISAHCEEIFKMGYTRQTPILIDPSCTALIREKNGVQVSIIDEFIDNGIYPITASNNNAGFMRVNQWFKEGRLKIFRNCINTIREVSGLRWKKVKPNFNKNLPEVMEDKDNHTCDCLNYFANSRPQASNAPRPENWWMKEREDQLKRIGKFKETSWEQYDKEFLL
jgi:phage terminase large subunit